MMMPEPTPIKRNGKRRLVISAGVVVIALALVATGYMLSFANRITPGVTVNGLPLGGLTKEAANAKLNATVTIYENSGLNFKYGERVASVETTQIPGGNVDAAHQILNFDEDSGLAAAYAIGHTGDLWNRLSEAVLALTGRYRLVLPYTLDTDGFKDALHVAWSAEETPVKNARLVITMNKNALTSVEVAPDASGFEFDFDRAISDLRGKLTTFDPTPVTLAPARTDPSVTTAAAETAKALVPQALALAPLAMRADEFKWTLTAFDLAPLVDAYLGSDGTPSLRIENEAAQKYFKRLATDYDITAADTRYEIDPATKKMTVFEPGRNGRKIDIDKSITALQDALAKRLAGEDGKKGFNVVTTAAKSQIITATGADLGIKEVIGIGVSDFSGSSTTRIKNIRHGSSKLSGVLIAPDAEFSAIDVLNPVTVEDGYFPEQIILGDKIEPGVGGGLCQIGTTLFRMAMNTGLPVTERQNHSLVVHYYSDPTNGNPGTDATLYGPHPDLRFINNTGHWMLLTTDVNTKTKALTYTLWGTSDGRHGSYNPPQVLNWTAAPAEVQNIDDPTLEPGKQKCQNAFRGANTVFTYTIVNPDGSITERKFNSHYRALPKICQNGPSVEAKSPQASQSEVSPLVPDANLNLPPEAAQGN